MIMDQPWEKIRSLHPLTTSEKENSNGVPRLTFVLLTGPNPGM